MAKKILAIRLLADEKQVQQAASFLDASDEIITQDDLHRRFFDREPVVVDLSEEELSMTLAFIALIINNEQEEN